MRQPKRVKSNVCSTQKILLANDGCEPSCRSLATDRRWSSTILQLHDTFSIAVCVCTDYLKSISIGCFSKYNLMAKPLFSVDAVSLTLVAGVSKNHIPFTRTPLLVDSAPTTDCPIPQKPVLVRQPVRHDFTIVPEQRPDAVNAFLPPVEYPGGQGRVRSATPSYHGEDELEFRSLESADHRETEINAPSPQIPVRSIHSSKNGRVLEDEEKERTIKFQHLKEREAESVSTSPILAASDSSRVVMTTTEVIDLNTPVHDRVTTTVRRDGTD
uniref:Uncharacterized protein n=1 Tax=Timema monikensis TaxID=170555 RepID=A0A7R9DZ23_9NEOP|nr:unnamed protein product [Timema monikensis]